MDDIPVDATDELNSTDNHAEKIRSLLVTIFETLKYGAALAYSTISWLGYFLATGFSCFVANIFGKMNKAHEEFDRAWAELSRENYSGAARHALAGGINLATASIDISMLSNATANAVETALAKHATKRAFAVALGRAFAPLLVIATIGYLTFLVAMKRDLEEALDAAEDYEPADD